MQNQSLVSQSLMMMMMMMMIMTLVNTADAADTANHLQIVPLTGLAHWLTD